ncbi:hypothetical protein [Kouleothrix sp.]
MRWPLAVWWPTMPSRVARSVQVGATGWSSLKALKRAGARSAAS